MNKPIAEMTLGELKLDLSRTESALDDYEIALKRGHKVPPEDLVMTLGRWRALKDEIYARKVTPC